MLNSKEEIAIVCFAYKRSYHLKKCLESILENKESRELPLIVYVDGAKNKCDENERDKVIELVNLTTGFKKIKLKERKTNFGLYLSLTKGISETLETYKKVIVIEDDICVSPFFLKYIIEALSLYQNEKKVASIHGYLPPIKEELPNSFFLKGADCWGWATWDDRWPLFRSDTENMRDEIKKLNLSKKFNLQNGFDYLGMLDDKIDGFNNSWAICWHASCFLKNKLTLHPGKSMVINIGLDNSGENCQPSESFESKLFKKHLNIKKIDINEDKTIIKYFSNHYKSKNLFLKSKLMRLFRYFYIDKLINFMFKN